MNDNVNPYRASDGPSPGFVCVTCYRTASVEAGNCSQCGSPRVPLESEQVRDDVRKQVDRKQNRAGNRRIAVAFVCFTLLAAGLYWLLGLAGVVDLHPPHRFRHAPINEFVFMPLWMACTLGGGYLVERRARRRHADTDPQTARVAELLEALGVHVE